MATKWDPLVLKYQRQNQQELGRLTELRRHLKETESNRDKVAERQTHFRRQLHTNTLREIDDWRVMKSFLADLDILPLVTTNMPVTIADFPAAHSPFGTTRLLYN